MQGRLCGGLPSNAKKASVPGKAAVTVDGFRSSLLGSSRGKPKVLRVVTTVPAANRAASTPCKDTLVLPSNFGLQRGNPVGSVLYTLTNLGRPYESKSLRTPILLADA